MVHPLLSILVAASVQCPADAPRHQDLDQIIQAITQAAEVLVPDSTSPGDAELTVRDIPYYYCDYTPLAVPETAPIVTYDWRSPVIFDLP